MKFTNEQKKDIGRRVCTHELTMVAASKEYQASLATINNSMKLYKASISQNPLPNPTNGTNRDQYLTMSKEELIDEIMRKDIEAARAKKGYEVKGDGQKKEYVILSKKNAK